VETPLLRLAALFTLIFMLSVETVAAQATSRRLYLVPGVHYGTPARTSFAITAFFDERGGTVGKGHLLILEGGRDVVKGQLGIADVSGSTFGYSLQFGALQTRTQPLAGVPNSRYAGTELHLLIKVLNFGAGFYAPVGDTKGRNGLLSLSAGLGF
jgi:hypothetical protein